MLKPSAAQGEKAGLPKSARLDARHFDLLLQAADAIAADLGRIAQRMTEMLSQLAPSV